MSDAGKLAIALGAWERAMTDYRAAAEQAFGRGALAGRPDEMMNRVTRPAETCR